MFYAADWPYVSHLQGNSLGGMAPDGADDKKKADEKVRHTLESPAANCVREEMLSSSRRLWNMTGRASSAKQARTSLTPPGLILAKVAACWTSVPPANFFPLLATLPSTEEGAEEVGAAAADTGREEEEAWT